MSLPSLLRAGSLLLVALVLDGAAAEAATIRLRDGSELRGRIVSETESTVSIEVRATPLAPISRERVTLIRPDTRGVVDEIHLKPIVGALVRVSPGLVTVAVGGRDHSIPTAQVARIVTAGNEERWEGEATLRGGRTRTGRMDLSNLERPVFSAVEEVPDDPEKAEVEVLAEDGTVRSEAAGRVGETVRVKFSDGRSITGKIVRRSVAAMLVERKSASFSGWNFLKYEPEPARAGKDRIELLPVRGTIQWISKDPATKRHIVCLRHPGGRTEVLPFPPAGERDVPLLSVERIVHRRSGGGRGEPRDEVRYESKLKSDKALRVTGRIVWSEFGKSIRVIPPARTIDVPRAEIEQIWRGSGAPTAEELTAEFADTARIKMKDGREIYAEILKSAPGGFTVREILVVRTLPWSEVRGVTMGGLTPLPGGGTVHAEETVEILTKIEGAEKEKPRRLTHALRGHVVSMNAAGIRFEDDGYGAAPLRAMGISLRSGACEIPWAVIVQIDQDLGPGGMRAPPDAAADRVRLADGSELLGRIAAASGELIRLDSRGAEKPVRISNAEIARVRRPRGIEDIPESGSRLTVEAGEEQKNLVRDEELGYSISFPKRWRAIILASRAEEGAKPASLRLVLEDGMAPSIGGFRRRIRFSVAGEMKNATLEEVRRREERLAEEYLFRGITREIERGPKASSLGTGYSLVVQVVMIRGSRRDIGRVECFVGLGGAVLEIDGEDTLANFQTNLVEIESVLRGFSVAAGAGGGITLPAPRRPAKETPEP